MSYFSGYMCMHTLSQRKKKTQPTAQIHQFNWNVMVDLLTTRFCGSSPMHWSPSHSHLSCCGFSWPFRDHGVMGGGSVQATLPSPQQGTAGAEESGHVGFCNSSNGAVISGKEQGHRRVAVSSINTQNLATDTTAFWGMFKSWLLRGNFHQNSAWGALRINWIQLSFYLSKVLPWPPGSKVSWAIER